MRDFFARHRRLILWTGTTTILIEGITLFLRYVTEYTVAEFNATDPLLVLQMHHMFWSVPLFLLLTIPIVRKIDWLKDAILGIALGLVFSDLIHHFIMLPILEDGNIGWHWP